MKDVKNIVIVGGGSAGWMSATAFIKLAPHIKVTLIESKNFPIVGVGESTLGQINDFLSACDIKDEDWMVDCGATYKTSIMFTNWENEKGNFHYPFGGANNNPQRTPNGLKDYHVLNHWNPEKYPLNKFDEFFHWGLHWFNNNKMFSPKTQPPGFNFNNDTAYHMDAIKFGQWLKNNICMGAENFSYVQDDVIDVVKEDDGTIKEIITPNLALEADLFIDCTGFKSYLLEGHMGEEFHSFEDTLMNDSAIAAQIPYIDKEIEMEHVTNCTAIENGWCWNTPLFDRIGMGYVYSSKFATKEEAEEQFRKHLASDEMVIGDKDRAEKAEMRHVPMRHGYHKRSWVKNVVAIGLSHAFIEPLESTGLLFVHDNIMEVVQKVINRHGAINRIDISNYNYDIGQRLHQMQEFVAMHFGYATRSDTPYWKHVTKEVDYYPNMEDFNNFTSITQTTATNMQMQRSLSIQKGEDFEDLYVSRAGMPYVITGTGINIISRNEFKYLSEEGDVETFGRFLDEQYEKDMKILSIEMENAPSHYEYLKSTLYKGKT